MNTKRLFFAIGILVGITALEATASDSPKLKGNPGLAGEACEPQSSLSLNFPENLTAQLPCDVPASASTEMSIDQRHRLFQIQGWKQFIALNWPFSNGQPTKNISDKGQQRWYHWKEAFDVFLTDGSTPSPWGSPQIVKAVCGKEKYDGMRVVFRTSKGAALTVADEVDQAFTYPLWDQSGNIIRYEVMLNKTEFDYILDHELYNIEGQIAFSQQNPAGVDFPIGSNTTKEAGVMEIKLAWKILEKDDIESRYLVSKALVLEQATNTCKPAKLGLVGMHISQKTESSPQWIWSTFEHVDNLDVDPIHGKVKKPTFFDPTCETCVHNVQPTPGPDGKKRNQVARVIPIDKETARLNSQVQALLHREKTSLQYYELVDTQWPVNPTCYPANTGASAEILTLREFKKQYPGCRPYQIWDSIDQETAKRLNYEGPRNKNKFVIVNDAEWKIQNKAGGQPKPAYLTNMTMETYFQDGNQKAQLMIQGFPFVDTPVFGTESCMGCHYSAGIAAAYNIAADGKTKEAVTGQPLTADFSWILGLKAHFKNPTVK